MWWLLLLIVLTVLAIVVTVYTLATLDIGFTFVPEGEIKFIIRGEALHRVLCNVKGWKYDEKNRVVVNDKTGKPNIGLLGSLIGIYGPFLFPLYSVHKYRFVWDKWKQEKDKTELTVERRDEVVDSMFFEYTYPVITKGVELADNFTVDISGNATVRAKSPYVAIFTLKGSWFLPLRAAIDGAIADYCQKLDFNKFRGEEKGGPNAKLTMEVLKINNDHDPVERRRKRKDGTIAVTTTKGGKGVGTTAGVEVVNYDFATFEISEDSKDVRAATQAQQVATLQGEATKTTANADAEGIRVRGQAIAESLKAQVEAAGPAVVISKNMTDAIVGFKGNFLNLGAGQSPMVSVEADSGKKKPY